MDKLIAKLAFKDNMIKLLLIMRSNKFITYTVFIK